MDEFDKAELEGRRIVYNLISGHCEEYYFTKDKYANVDLFVTGKTGIEAVIEIKNRSAYTSTDIDNMGGHMLEWHKYTGLTSYNGYKPIYTMVYPDCMMMWDVSNLEPERFETVDGKYTHTTVGDKKEKIKKKVAYLKKSECCTIIKRNDEQNG